MAVYKVNLDLLIGRLWWHNTRLRQSRYRRHINTQFTYQGKDASKSCLASLNEPDNKWKVPLNKRASVLYCDSDSEDSISSVHAAKISSYFCSSNACLARAKPCNFSCVVTDSGRRMFCKGSATKERK
ncbi:hypothetical protein CVS40_4380 [Lucilia cuprina]|nr:hypothetical protein CVS40_4380 [Lucilia cuprina]